MRLRVPRNGVEDKMNNHVTLLEVKSRLEEQGIAYEILEVGNGMKLLLTQRGARAIGPFLGEEGESVFWLNKAFKDADAFARFVGEGAWNLGGERLWLQPELRLFCEAPEKFDIDYIVQPGIDPGNWEIERTQKRIVLRQDTEFKALDNGTTKRCLIERAYWPAENPLRYAACDGLKNVTYYGFFQHIDLVDKTPENPVRLEPWLLTQMTPGGTVIVPYFGNFSYDDYYEPVGDLLDDHPGFDGLSYAELQATGYTKYKVAFKSATTFGRMAHLQKAGDFWRLMIRNYYNDPSLAYGGEPWKRVGELGTSTYFYNDNGLSGGFLEFENACTPVDDETHRSSSDTSLWFFEGSKREISAIMRILLGVNYEWSDAQA